MREFHALKYAMLESMDQAVGRILASLKTRGVLDDTLIVFFNDNGGRRENPPYRGGKGETFEGGVRVPCILRWPHRVPAGRSVAALIHVVDLYPTLLGQSGASLNQPLPLDGIDMWNTITLDQESPRREVVHALPGEHIDTGPMSIRQGAYKLVDSALFNIEQDPTEANDLADRHPEIYRSLHQRLLQLVDERRMPETHTNISQTISQPLLVFGKEENADPPAWLAPYVKSLPPTKKELQRAKSARSK
jgi:arylsulfatase A-like enzyme